MGIEEMTSLKESQRKYDTMNVSYILYNINQAIRIVTTRNSGFTNVFAFPVYGHLKGL